MALALALSCALVAATTAAAHAPRIETGVFDPMSSAGGAYYSYAYLPPSVAFPATRSTGSTLVRIPLFWRRVSPNYKSATRPAKNLADPATYNWSGQYGLAGYDQGGFDFDRDVKAAVDAGLKPVISIFEAPAWAECDGHGFRGGNCHPAPPSGPDDGSFQPSPQDFASFVTALMAHIASYPAKYRDAIHYFQVWNEPNLRRYWKPMGGTYDDAAVDRYRSMLNAAAPVIHSPPDGDPANKVITGGTSPRFTIPPRKFFRMLVSKPVRFDVWSNHPYTGDVNADAGPTTRAPVPDAVWLGDLPSVNKELQQAHRHGKVLSASAPQFWVTEFSWDSSGPDCRWGTWNGQTVNGAVPLRLLSHWVSELPYYLWKANVSALIWHQLKDNPMQWTPPGGGATIYPSYQGGLFFASKHDGTNDGGPKGAMYAFRFPLYAKRTSKYVYVWGRRPFSTASTVTIQWRHRGGNWKRIAVIRPSSKDMLGGGVFRKWIKLTTRKDDTVRAWTRTASGVVKTIEFTLKEPPNQQFSPWGCQHS